MQKLFLLSILGCDFLNAAPVTPQATLPKRKLYDAEEAKDWDKALNLVISYPKFKGEPYEWDPIKRLIERYPEEIVIKFFDNLPSWLNEKISTRPDPWGLLFASGRGPLILKLISKYPGAYNKGMSYFYPRILSARINLELDFLRDIGQKYPEIFFDKGRTNEIALNYFLTPRASAFLFQFLENHRELLLQKDEKGKYLFRIRFEKDNEELIKAILLKFPELLKRDTFLYPEDTLNLSCLEQILKIYPEMYKKIKNIGRSYLKAMNDVRYRDLLSKFYANNPELLTTRSYGNLPLHDALSYSGIDLSITQLLLDLNPDTFFEKDRYGRLPIEIAKSQGVEYRFAKLAQAIEPDKAVTPSSENGAIYELNRFAEDITLNDEELNIYQRLRRVYWPRYFKNLAAYPTDSSEFKQPMWLSTGLSKVIEPYFITLAHIPKLHARFGEEAANKIIDDLNIFIFNLFTIQTTLQPEASVKDASFLHFIYSQYYRTKERSKSTTKISTYSLKAKALENIMAKFKEQPAFTDLMLNLDYKIKTEMGRKELDMDSDAYIGLITDAATPETLKKKPKKNSPSK